MRKKSVLKRAASILLVFCMFVSLYPFVPGVLYSETGKSFAAQESGGDHPLVAQAEKYKDISSLASVKRAMRASGYNIWNEGYTGEWCAWFVSNCAREAGIAESVIKNITCAETDFYRKQKRFYYGNAYGGSYVPVAGDLIYFDWAYNGRNGLSDHIGIVRYSKNGRVYTIEGNSSNAVKHRSYSLGSYDVYGFAHPQYCKNHKWNENTGVCTNKNCGVAYSSVDETLNDFITDGEFTKINKDNPEKSRIYWISKDNTKIRVYPSEKGKVLRTCNKQKCVKVIGKRTVGGKVWYKIQHTGSSRDVGYIPSTNIAQYRPTESGSALVVGTSQNPIQVRGGKLYGKVSSNYALWTVRIFINSEKDANRVYSTGQLVQSTQSSQELSEITNIQSLFKAKTKNLKSYKVIVVAKDYSGKRVAKTIEVKNGESVITSTLPKPTMGKQKAIANGYEVTLSQTSGATLHYEIEKDGKKLSSGTKTGTSAVLPKITTEGRTRITAWSTKSGYKDSGKASWNIDVTKAEAPYVTDRQIGEHVELELSAAPGAKIRIRKGSEKNFSDYAGGMITLKDGEEISYYAVENGHTDSGVETYTAEVTAPDAPEISLTSPSKDIATGKTVTVGWSEDKRATGYTATLYDDQDNAAEELKTDKTSATFTVKKAGEYYVQVTATNEIGESEQSNAVEIIAHDPLQVVFRDDDEAGTILCSLTVEYGEKTGPVQAPSRKGSTFSGWENETTGSVSANDYQKTAVKEDTTYKAVYAKREYTVKIRNQNGKIIDTQKVRYGEAVDIGSVKDNIPTDDGYVLSGWQVLSTSDGDSASDINFVDSNMDIQAVVSWENPDLPVVAEVTKAELKSSGKAVDVGIKLSTEQDKDLKFYVIAALKAEDAETEGLEKTIYTDRKIVYLNAGSRDEKLTNIDMQLLANATDELSKVEVTAVQCNEDMSTGGAYSAAAWREVEIPSTVTKWGAWSDWSETKPEKTDNNEIETLTEYRSRSKEYTYSGYETLDGYTKLSEEKISESQGKWETSNPGSATDRYKDYKEVRTVKSASAKRYVTHFCGCYKWAYRNNDGVCKYCGGKTTNQYVLYVTPAMSNTIKKGAYDSKDGSYEYKVTTLKDVSQNSSSGVYVILHNDKRVTSVTTKAVTSRFYLYPASKNFDSTVWQATYTKIRNKFWRWGSWSDWSTSEIAKTAEREVETREVYRVREKVTETTSGSASVKVALDPDGSLAKKVHGTLSDLGVEQDLSGRRATVMVYQVNNDDPNKYQLRHLGHTTIQDGNVYDFSFVPERKPDAETGDYIISLAVEGFSGLIRVDSIKAPARTYEVSLGYIGEDGKTVTVKQKVEEHGNFDLSKIEVPARKGYYFAGWSAPTTNITETSVKDISAVYIPERNAVVFVDWVKQTADIQKAETGTRIAAPAAEGEPEGYVFKGWKLEDGTIVDPQASDEANMIDVTGDMVITAEYEVAKHTVTFLDAAGKVLETQEVEHGRSAKLPEYTGTAEGVEFLGWGTDEPWWSVEEDVTVRPIFRYEDTAATPISYTDVDDQSGAVNLVLDTDDEETTIYYTTDGTVPTEDRIQEYLQTPAAEYTGSIMKYAGPISLIDERLQGAAEEVSGDETADEMTMDILAVGYTEGKNLSEVHSALLTDGEQDDPLTTDAADSEWIEVGTYEVKVAAGRDVHVIVDITDNPGITGYEVLVEDPEGVLYADRDEYGNPVVTDGIAVTDGAVSTSDEDNGWRISWNAIGTYEKDGNLFELVLHADEDVQEGVYPVKISYAPERTLDYEYDPTELSGLKARVSSEASVDISTKTVALARDSYVYEGTELEPAVRIEGLKEGTDFTVAYESNVDVGTGKVTVTGIGDYAGSVVKEFTITQANIANADIEAIPDQTKTGSAIEPELKVTFNGTALEEGTDYEVTYTGNTEVGTATATIRGIGNFKGTNTAEFKVIETTESRLEQALRDKEAAEQALKEAEEQKKAAEADREAAEQRAKTAEEELSTTQGQLEEAQAAADEANAAKEELEAQLAEEQEASEELQTQLDEAKAAADEANAKLEEAQQAKTDLEGQLAEANQAKEEAEKQIEEANKAKEEAEKRAEEAEQALAEATQGGGNTEPEKQDPPKGKVTILNTVANSAKKTNDVIWDKSKVSGATGYEINWRARGASKWASKKVGNVSRGVTSGLSIGGLYEIRVRPYKAATATAEAAYGEWSASVYRYFYTTQKIRLASNSKGSFTMSWAKDPNATGYQVLYTTNKNGAGAAQNIKTAGKSATSITVKDIKVNGKAQALRSGTTYYVQVREIRKVGGITYIGNISCPVAVKVK